MITYDELVEARPEYLAELADEWERAADAIDQVGADFGSRVCSKVDEPSIWRGDAATQASAHCGDLQRATFRGSDHLRDVPIVLRVAERGIGEAQYAAQRATDDALGAGLTISGGQVLGPGGVREVPAEYVELANEVNERIADALAQAGAARDDLIAGLRDERVDIADASQVDAEILAAENAGTRAAELSALGPRMSSAQQAELARLLDDQATDSSFATRLHERLGPDGAFQLYADLAGTHHGTQPPNAAIADRLAAIQAGLGESLAAATNWSGQPHVDDRWREEFDAAAQRQYPVGGLMQHQPYGYQILGGLLQTGDYQPDFLDQVGDSMLAFENRNPQIWADAAPYGADAAFDLSLNDNGGSAGQDPVVDLFAALDDDPDAARMFLDPEDNPDRTGYLLAERDYLGPTMDFTGDPQNHDAYDALGEVFEAATIESPRDHHSAAIVSELVHVLGEPGRGPEGNFPPDLRDNVANILANHMDDVTYTMNSSVQESTITQDGADRDRVGRNGEVNMSIGALTNVLNGVAGDPAAWRTLWDANTVHASIQMAEMAGIHSDSPHGLRAEAVRGELERSATVFGALTGAQQQALMGVSESEKIAYEGDLARRAALGSLGVGALTALIPSSGAGAAAGGFGNYLITDMVEDLKAQNAERSGHQAQQAVAATNWELDAHLRNLANQAIIDYQLYEPDRPPPIDKLLVEPGHTAGHPMQGSVVASTWNYDQQQDFDKWITDQADPVHPKYGTPPVEQDFVNRVLDAGDQAKEDGNDGS